MPWFLLACTTFLSLLSQVDSLKLPAIHWNSTNSMFKTSNNDHIINVNMYDEIDFICPHYDSSSKSTITESLHEYYIIYSVSKKEYDNCNIEGSRLTMIINCSQPVSDQARKYTLIFESFNPFGGPQFTEGQSYYYITTSTGNKEGMHNTHQGACWFNKMKLTVRVLPLTTSTSSTMATPSKNNTNSSVEPDYPGSGDNFNWTGSGSVLNDSDPSPLPPSQTEGPVGEASTTTTVKTTTTTIRGRPWDQEDTTTTPWWWWETVKPKTETPPTYKPPFEDKDIVQNEIDPRKEGLVDSSSLAVPSLVLHLVCWCLTLLFHRNIMR